MLLLRKVSTAFGPMASLVVEVTDQWYRERISDRKYCRRQGLREQLLKSRYVICLEH